MINKVPNSKPIELSVTSGVSLYFKLVDKRVKTAGIVFGTVEKVAKQYGIKIKNSETDNRLIFTAPRSRLQLFVEKLHFSGVHYVSV